MYSLNVRISIQNVLFLYSLFSVVWAFWQLYRNVDIIQHVLEPIIVVLKEVYLGFKVIGGNAVGLFVSEVKPRSCARETRFWRSTDRMLVT